MASHGAHTSADPKHQDRNRTGRPHRAEGKGARPQQGPRRGRGGETQTRAPQGKGRDPKGPHKGKGGETPKGPEHREK